MAKPATISELGLAGAGALQTAHSPVREAEAVEVLDRQWGITGRAHRLASEKDDTFAVAQDGERRFTLKVSNPAEDVDEVDFEVQLLRHVAQSGYRVPVPAVLADRDGQAISTVTDRTGVPRLARLMTFIPGTVLDATDSTPIEREAVGRVLARLRHATQSFTHRADRRVIAWDVRHLPELTPLLDAVTDSEHRQLLIAGIDRFLRIAPVLARQRCQVLHNDFSRSNIIVAHDDPEFVRGVIDFGDAVYTGVAVDVSTALLNQLPTGPHNRDVDDLFADGRDLLRGYLSVADLTGEELELIPHLVMGRVIARALITVHRARLVPANAEYILRNTEPGWGQLRWFLDRSFERVTESLRA
jgi:Ser/Thr protein kinase RdoA (MazF antagonist)